MLFAPESPIWLLQKGLKDQAITILNKIAKFNCEAKTIPHNAEFDLLGEAVNLHNELRQSPNGMQRAALRS